MTGSTRAPTPRVILITDGEQRAALVCVRSLGAAGHRVIVGSSRSKSIAGASRFANDRVGLPDPLSQPNAFLSSVADVVRDQGVEVLLPVTEQSLLPVLGARERFPNVTIPFARLDQFERISNKAALIEAA